MFVNLQDPLHLGTCVISAELEDEDIIEIQEYTTKESIFLKVRIPMILLLFKFSLICCDLDYIFII